MPTYMIRKVEPELARKVKVKAAQDQVSIQGLVTWLLTLYVKRGLSAFEAIDGKYPRG